MAPIKQFLAEIDAQWKPLGDEPIVLQIIGSAALMLQADYDRGTKDSDVLESPAAPQAVKDQLLRLAGPKSAIHERFKLYLDVVKRAILFLPQRPIFHARPEIVLGNFKVEVLDVTDVVLSKLKRYNRDDANDIRAMADRGLIDHPRLVERFKAAADWFSVDARAVEVPRYLEKLHIVERDILALPFSELELPPECEAD